MGRGNPSQKKMEVEATVWAGSICQWGSTTAVYSFPRQRSSKPDEMEIIILDDDDEVEMKDHGYAIVMKKNGDDNNNNNLADGSPSDADEEITSPDQDEDHMIIPISSSEDDDGDGDNSSDDDGDNSSSDDDNGSSDDETIVEYGDRVDKKARGPYKKWPIDDKLALVRMDAKLRKENQGVEVKAPTLLKELQKARLLRRENVNARKILDERRNLKRKFKEILSGKKTRKYRPRRRRKEEQLHKCFEQEWPHVRDEARAAKRQARAAAMLNRGHEIVALD